MVVNVEFRKAHDHTPAVERSHMIVGPKVGCSSALRTRLASARSPPLPFWLPRRQFAPCNHPSYPCYIGETEGYECAACIARMPACNPGGTQIARVTVKMNQSASTRVMCFSPHHLALRGGILTPQPWQTISTIWRRRTSGRRRGLKATFQQSTKRMASSMPPRNRTSCC